MPVSSTSILSAAGRFGKTGHGHDIARQSDNEASTGRNLRLAHRDAETARSAELRLVVGEAVLGLRHANRHMGETERLKLRNLLFCSRRKINAVGMIDALSDSLDLLWRSTGRPRRRS